MSRPRVYQRPRNLDDEVMTSMRIKERMRRQITKAAERNRRSFNSEVVERLAASLTTDTRKQQLERTRE